MHRPEPHGHLLSVHGDSGNVVDFKHTVTGLSIDYNHFCFVRTLSVHSTIKITLSTCVNVEMCCATIYN